MARAVTADFWRFALKIYRRSGVADACLELQDHLNAEISVVLWTLYAGWSGRGGVSVAEIDAALVAVAPITQSVLHPLRAARRGLKSLGTTPDGLALYRRAQALELAVERQVFDLLAERLSGIPVDPAADRRADAARSLDTYLATLGGESRASPVLIAAAFARSSRVRTSLLVAADL